MTWFGGIRLRGVRFAPPDDSSGGTESEQALDNLIGDQTLPEGDVETAPETTETKSETKPEAKAEDSRYEDMQRRLAEMEETNATLRAENAIHRTRASQPPSRPASAEAEDEDGELPDDDTFRQMAQKTPVRAVETVVERAVRRATRDLEKRLRGEMRGASTLERVRQRALADYGEYLVDNDFVQAAEAEYAALRDEDGKNRPQDIYTAYATAYANMVRSGKQPKRKNGNGGGPTEGLRERTRRATSTDIGSGTPASAAGKLTPFDQDFRTERELAGARASAKKFGMTLEQFKKSYNEEKGRNPHYGSGI